MGARVPVEARGEGTSLAERKLRAGQRLLLVLPEPRLGGELRALLRALRPAGFVLDPSLAEEPAQVLDACAELAGRLPAAQPALLLARPSGTAPAAGGADWPPLSWLARAGDPGLTRAAGLARRRELAALGFHLDLGPSLDLAALPGEPLPAAARAEAAGPDAAAALVAFLACGDEAAEACPAAFAGALDAGGRLVALEEELRAPGAAALAPLRAALGAGVPALLVGYAIAAAFDEDRPACCAAALLDGFLRETAGFRGLLVGEELGPPAVRAHWTLEEQLLLGLAASADLFLAAGDPDAQFVAFEALVRLQEEHPELDPRIEDSERRLLRARERLLIGRRRPPLGIVGCPDHQALALLARVRGAP